MLDRLSDSEKEKLQSKLEQTGSIPTSKLLEKLSHEITANFKGEHHPGVYKEAIKKMLSLKEKIDKKNESISLLEKELENLSAHLSEEKKREFYNAIEGAREVLKNSQDLIANIKGEINIYTPIDGKFTTKLFGQNLISRGKHPQNIGDQFIGGGIGLFNSGEAIAGISVDLLIGIGKSIPDTYKILTGKAECDVFKNM